MTYFTQIFYRDKQLVNLLNDQNDSNKILYIGLFGEDNDNLAITFHRCICLTNVMEIYTYSISSGTLSYTNKYVLHPMYSHDAFRSNYMEIIEG